jgi:hypothetical protein
MNPLTTQQQQRITGQIYLLMEKQVKSYHKLRHIGNHSSVPIVLAQELMESVEYTCNQAGGIYCHPDAETAFRLGQEILETKCQKAKKMLELVQATAPAWQTECRWEALRYLRRYLEQYDHRHLAHQGPDALYYPILIAQPEGIRGIDSCLFYLNVLWVENQIMAGISEGALEAFWDRLPAGTLNQCESLLLNCMGKALLNSGIHEVLLKPEEHLRLTVLMTHVTEGMLFAAADRLCQWLMLTDENAKDYVYAVISQLLCRIDDSAYDWNSLFL